MNKNPIIDKKMKKYISKNIFNDIHDIHESYIQEIKKDYKDTIIDSHQINSRESQTK